MKFNTWTLRLALLALPFFVVGCKDDNFGDKVEEVGNDVKREVEDAVD